jgi:hypothetical protein
MNALQIVAICFLAVTLLFLMYLVLSERKTEIDRERFEIVRVIASICGGFAAGLYIGDLHLLIQSKIPGGQITVSAATGAAGFALVFWFFGRKTVSGSWYNAAIPEGYTFRRAVSTLAEQDRRAAAFEGFTQQHLDAPLSASTIKERNIVGALAAVRKLSVAVPIPKYDVEPDSSTYLLRVTNGSTRREPDKALESGKVL